MIESSRKQSKAVESCRSKAVDSFRWLSIALALLCAGAARAEIAASPWAASAAVRFDTRDTLGGRIVHGVETRGEPDGAAVAPWNTTALADGWHEIASGDAGGSPAVTNVLALNSPSIAIEGGRLLSNMSWASNATHLVRHWVVVPSGVTLTVTEGAVVKLCPGAGIKVEDGGMLSLAGAAGAEVIVTDVADADFGAVIDCGNYAGQSTAIEGIRLQSSAATFSDNTHVRFIFSSSFFPTVSIQDASAKRSDGIARIPVTISGTARDTAFRVDWEAVDGSALFGEDYLLASGTLSWSKSSDGTKQIEIPLDTANLRGSNTTFRVKLTAHYACNVAVGEAEVVVREFDFPELDCSAWAGSAAIRFDGREGLAGAIATGVETRGEPDGSAAAPWDTTALADGWHEIAATNGSTADVLALNSPSIAVEGGRLQSNTTWTSSATHLVRHTVVVPSGRTLTIGPDAVVKFLPGTFIKVEDGGTLSVAGSRGHDAILTVVNDDTAGAVIDCGAYAGQAIAFDGIRLQSSAATFTDNSWLQTRGFNYGAYPYVRLNDTVAFRDGGMAYVPVSIASGTRNQSFSIDWEAVDGTATFGADYTLASGSIEWTGTSQGTKTLQLPIVTDHIVGETTSFKLRIAVNRGCNRYGTGECTVTIRELDTISFASGEAQSAPVRFDTRETIGGRIVHGVEMRGEPDGSAFAPWDTTALADGWHEISGSAGGSPAVAEVLALNSPSIAIEGGRLLSNATWDATKTHLVRHTVVVPSGVTLTVTAGAVVKFCPEAGILVQDGGKLVVNGADGSDVIFTRWDDDTAGALVPGGAFAGQSTAIEGIRLQSSSATFQDNGWYQVRGVSHNISNVGALSIHGAEVSRKAGVAYVAVSVGGNTRNQSFTADWEAVPGTATLGRDYTLASGRLTWSKSGDGTKWIAIPLNTKTETDERRSFTVRLKTVRGMNGAGAKATVEIREYDEGALDGRAVAFFPEGEGCVPFAIDEPIWKEPIFRHYEEPIRLSGTWQNMADPNDTIVRLSWSSDNGGGVLAEVPGGEPATYTWRAADWDVGSYVLRHDILDAVSGRRIASYEKIFAVPSWDGVELHGGTLMCNETWRAGVVHVVYETVRAPALYTILLEPGAIVKFLTGTGIVIEEGGGALFANGVVFTHINDDTVGGDTLNDGATLAPVMDAYTFTGALTIGEESELRYKTQAPLSGTISSSRKLTRGSTYRVSGNVTIASGATLTIPAGTILKFDQGVQMTVNSGGTLLANGTRAAPVIFTSMRDDEYGGDTNGDGDATLPQPGDWATIKVAGGRGEFHHSKILYSSRNQTTGAINQNGGTVVFDGGEIAHGLYDAVGVESGSFFMTNVVIRDCLQAFRHWARDPIVNCVIYDCGRLTQGGSQTFVNCVFSGIDETWEAFGFPRSTYRNCVFWNESGSVLTAEGTQDALTVCGQDGNVWGDPKFRDPDNGDFHIREGSVCIDAADASAAPSLDLYGQKRYTWTTAESGAGALPDIGVAECVPRNAASDIDLVPVSVTCAAASAKPGQTLFLHWTTANEGGEAVETEWWDELALVSASGRVTVLGEKVQSNRIAAGGETTGTGYFTVPVLSEGTYAIRLQVNSRRDVPEGTRTDNNALIADAALSIAVDAASVDDGAFGTILAGGTVVRKFELGADAPATLVRVRAPAGAVVSWQAGGSPGGSAPPTNKTVVDEFGEVVFAVPAGTETLYVALEGGGEAGQYDVVFEDGSLAVSSVSPATVPRSGRVTLRVSGAGFGEDAALAFVAPSGAEVAPLSLVRESAEALWATVDCAALAAAGGRFAARVETDAASATLPSALAVTGEAGTGHLWARLDVPTAIRRGSRATCRILYGNDGNSDIAAPVLQIACDGGGSLEYMNGRGGFSAIQFIGAGDSSVAGVLRPGEERTISFRYRSDGSGSVYLYTSEEQTWFEAPWTNAAEMFADLAAAATRIGLRGQDATDYELVQDLAAAVKRGEPTSTIYGRVVDQNGAGVPDAIVAILDADTNLVCHARSDGDGWYCTEAIDAGAYWLDVADLSSIDGAILVELDGDADIHSPDVVVDVFPCVRVCFVNVPNDAEISAGISSFDGVQTIAARWENPRTATFCGASAGLWMLNATAGTCSAFATVDVKAGDTTLVECEFSRGGTISGVMENASDSGACGVIVVGGNGLFRFVELDDNGGFSIVGLPDGEYQVSALGVESGLYEAATNLVICGGGELAIILSSVEGGLRNVSSMANRLDANASATPRSFSLFNWTMPWNLRSELAKDIEELDRWIDETRGWVTYPNPACSHNLAKYERDNRAVDIMWRAHDRMAELYRSTDRSYFDGIWENLSLSALNFGDALLRAKLLEVGALTGFTDSLTGIVSEFGTAAIEGDVPLTMQGKTVLEVMKEYANNVMIPNRLPSPQELWEFPDRLERVAANSSVWIDIWKVWSGDADEKLDRVIQWEEDVIELYESAEKCIKLLEFLAATSTADAAWAMTSEKFKTLGQPVSGFKAWAGIVMPALKYHMHLMKALRTSDQGFAALGAAHRKIRSELEWYDRNMPLFKHESELFGAYHNPCPDDEYDIPLFDDYVDRVTPTIPQSIDPNEVVGPAGEGDPDTERFVQPGEWLDYTIYFENATNATASAMQVRVTEDLDEHLDWDSLELGEVVFAGETDRGLVGLHSGTSEYAVPGTNYSVRTTFTLRNGVASWHIRMVDPDGDEDGWPLDAYAGFLPPNGTNHLGEGHVSYRIKVRDDAPKNVRIGAAAEIVFDWNETVPTDPSWWNTTGHLPVDLTFDRNCNDVVLGMPAAGAYPCDAPDFGTPQREGWLFLGWADTNGVARNCGADLPYGTATLDLFAQWREEVETRFATVAVDGGVLITGLADGQACPAALVIPATVEVGGRRVKVVGVADDAFKGKRAITSLVVMEGVRTIGARSFMNCTSLASVSLPSTIESIGENAFYGCRLLTSVSLAAETPPTLGSGVFRSVAAAGTLIVPAGEEEAYAAWIGGDLGSAWSLATSEFGEPEEPGEPEWTLLAAQNLLLYAAGSSDIRWTIEVEINTNDCSLALVRASTTEDPGAALTLPDPVLDENGVAYRIVALGTNGDILDAGLFEGLDIASVTIPESVETIAPCAFANCASLTEVVFTGETPALRTLGEGAFFGCTALRSIDLSALAALEIVGTTDDTLGVFESCWNLPSVTLPAGIEEIGAYAFQDCSRLRSVAFVPSGADMLGAIGERAFYNCDLLSSFGWEALTGLEEIGAAAFGGDTAASAPKIAKATLGPNVASLGAGAFLNASCLTEITCLATNPPVRGPDAFRGVARTGRLRVPDVSVEDYTNATARAWVGEGGGKLTPWNGSIGWKVGSGEDIDELREHLVHLDDEEYGTFVELATGLGFTTNELCAIDHPDELLQPALRIVSFQMNPPSCAMTVQLENGIDPTPSEALARFMENGAWRMYLVAFETFGGEEAEIPLAGLLDDNGAFEINLGALPASSSPTRLFQIEIRGD